MGVPGGEAQAHEVMRQTREELFVSGTRDQSSRHSAPGWRDRLSEIAQILARKEAFPAASENVVGAQWSSDRVGTGPIRAGT